MRAVAFSLQGYPVRLDKTPEACRVMVRHRRAYEGRPQDRAEGAQAKPPISDEGQAETGDQLTRLGNLTPWARQYLIPVSGSNSFSKICPHP